MHSPASLQQHLAAIVESSNDAIITNDLEGMILSWNRGAEALFGYSPEEAVGRSVAMLMADERRSEERDFLARLRRGERIQNHETTRRRKNGDLVEVS